MSWRDRVAQSAQRAVAQAINPSSGTWIKTQGGRFTFKDLHLNEIECIIISKAIEHADYEAGFNPDNPANPRCFALALEPEGMAPDDASEEKQNDTCAGCPQMEWGSADQGRGKHCKQIRRLALIPMPSGKLTPELIAEQELAYLKIPVMSVSGIDQYVVSLCENGAEWMYPTRLKIVPDPKSQFRIVAELMTRNAKPFQEILYDAINEKIAEAEKELLRPYTPIEHAEPAPRGRAAKPAPTRAAKPAPTRAAKPTPAARPAAPVKPLPKKAKF